MLPARWIAPANDRGSPAEALREERGALCGSSFSELLGSAICLARSRPSRPAPRRFAPPAAHSSLFLFPAASGSLVGARVLPGSRLRAAPQRPGPGPLWRPLFCNSPCAFEPLCPFRRSLSGPGPSAGDSPVGPNHAQRHLSTRSVSRSRRSAQPYNPRLQRTSLRCARSPLNRIVRQQTPHVRFHSHRRVAQDT